MSRNYSGFYQLLVDRPIEETTVSYLQGHNDTSGRPQPSIAKGNSRLNPRSHSGKKPSTSGIEPLSAVGFAADILQLVVFAAKTSFNLTSVYRDYRVAPREFQVLSQRLTQYSGILQAAAEVVRASMPTRELQQLGLEILNDSTRR